MLPMAPRRFTAVHCHRNSLCSVFNGTEGLFAVPEKLPFHLKELMMLQISLGFRLFRPPILSCVQMSPPKQSLVNQ